MSTKHISEPWSIAKDNGIVIESVSNDEDVCMCWSKADAMRIVSCVNAMADIENPQKLRETWEAVKHLELDQAIKYKEQRNALLEAYKLLLPSMYSGMLTTDQVKTLEAAEKIWEEIEQNGNNLTNES